MAAEGEHAGPLPQRLRGAGKAVGGGAPALGRIGHPQLVEAAAGEPVADLRQQVRGPAAAGPHHRAVPGAQLGAVADRALDVRVGDVAEHAADQDQVGGRHPGVGVGQCRVGGHHLDPGQARRSCRLAGHAGVARVDFDQPGLDVMPAGVAGQGADQVAALARAHADGAQRARPGLVQRGADLVLHRGQAPGQHGARLVVGVVPGVPVVFGHGGHGTDVRDNTEMGRGRHRHPAGDGPHRFSPGCIR
jgi:hypothetical protein